MPRWSRPAVAPSSMGAQAPEREARMDLGLDGRVALVMGGSRGLGRATALELLREGASVMVVARDAGRLAAAAAELGRDGERLSRRAGDRLDPVTADDADIWLENGPRRARPPAAQRVAWFSADLAKPDAPGAAVDADRKSVV